MSYSDSLTEMEAASFPQGINRFVSQTYSYFLVALAAITGIGFASFHYFPQQYLTHLGVANLVVWVLCGWLGWRRPIGIVFPLFTLVSGLYIGQLAHAYPADIFSMAAMITLITFTGLTGVVWVTGKDFSFLRGFLSIAFFALLGGVVASFFFESSMFTLVVSCLGVVTFGGWILHDTSSILQRAAYGGGEPGVAAFDLLFDIVGLFLSLLRMLGVLRGGD